MAGKERGLYFKYLRNEQNEEINYEYSAPKYGESNTDTSYYEPNSTRIANMYKSASGLSSGAYDFEAGKKVDIEDTRIPVGRKPGMTFEEISQMQTDNNNRIKMQSRKIEESDSDKDTAIQNAVEIANAIRNSGKEE